MADALLAALTIGMLVSDWWDGQAGPHPYPVARDHQRWPGFWWCTRCNAEADCALRRSARSGCLHRCGAYCALSLEVVMRAHVGDRLHVHGRVVGHAEHTAQIVEIREPAAGQSIFAVRYDDGRQTLISPGPDTVVEHQTDCPSS